MEYYPRAVEQLPPDAPKLRGMSMSCFVNADHAGLGHMLVTYLGPHLVHFVPTVWYSKQQNMVESSTLGSEFIAIKTAVKHSAIAHHIIHARHWLMGVLELQRNV